MPDAASSPPLVPERKENPFLTRAPFLVGVYGCTEPKGYRADKGLDDFPELRDAFDGMLQWIHWAPCAGRLSSEIPRFVRGDATPVNIIDEHGNLVQYNACWKPLGNHATPTVILTSLKPGIDTLFVEAALAFREAHPYWSLQIRIVSPYETLDEYLNCGLFGEDADRERLHSLVSRLRALPDWQEDRDWIPVTLDNDWKSGGDQVILLDRIAFERRLAGFSIPSLQQKLRLRASGEYIAAFSDLLIAIYDHPLEKETSKPEDMFDASTHSIVEAKRSGLAWELIAVTNNFTWADNGPVLRMGYESAARTRVSGVPAFQEIAEHLVFEHPYDTKPSVKTSASHGGEAANTAAWQAIGDSIFRRILRLQDEFNQLPLDSKEVREIRNMLLHNEKELKKNIGKTDRIGHPVRERKSNAEVDETIATLLPQRDAMNFAMRLQSAAAVRRRAVSKTYRIEDQRKTLMIRLAWLIGIAAVLLGAYEHWHSQGAEQEHLNHHAQTKHEKTHVSNDHGEKSSVDEHQCQVKSAEASKHSHFIMMDHRIRVVLISGSLACVVAAGWLYARYAVSRSEQKRYDYRALGEALRVQIYWAMAGLNRSAASDYLQRQRDELDWIRYVVCGVVFPFRRWKTGFKSLQDDSQLALLRRVRVAWVESQEDYFKEKIEKLETNHHFWHWLAWSFAVAGSLQLGFMLVHDLSQWLDWKSLEHVALRIQVGSMILALPTAVRCLEGMVNHRPHAHSTVPAISDEDPWSVWMASKWDNLGTAAFINSMLGLVYTYLPLLPMIGMYLPKAHDWWIILNGTILLVGGLSLAWAERNFYTEEHRSFSSMRTLYHSANMRLESILDQMEVLQRDHPARKHDRERLLLEAQDILYNLGCEHLSENADWLIYHRARPLEPFMAG